MNVLALAVRRALLWVITTAVPVVLSACYGVMYGFRRAGRVVDRTSGKAIPGLKIQCLNKHNHVVGEGTTSGDGRYYLRCDEPYDRVVVTDVDGDANGGDFGTTEIPLDSDEPVKLEPKR